MAKPIPSIRRRGPSMTVGTPMALLLAMTLSACAPGAPRMGHYGGAPGIASAPANLPPDPCLEAQPQTICWTPVRAQFHPDGQRMVVNLCSNRRGTPQDQYRGGIYYCRMVEYHLGSQRWHLIAGQEPDKSYLYPSYSHDGKTLVFGVDDCEQPHCIGGVGLGQLATMSVRPQAGGPASYGPAQRWPVHGMNRPSFSRDDQRVVYWRNQHSVRLASGRSLGSVSVFEYRFATDEETHPINPLHGQGPNSKSVRFINAWNAPRYSLDGQVLRFSGQVDNIARTREQVWINGGIVDVEYRQEPFSLIHRRMGIDVMGPEMVFAEHPTHGLLAGARKLRLVDPQTHQTTRVLLQPLYDRINQADIDLGGRWVVAVIGGRNLVTSGQGKQRAFWKKVRDPKRDTRGTEAWTDDVPVLPLIELATGQVQALHWPNVETLGSTPTH